MTIVAGMSGASFTISLIADTLAEADEMFGLELTVDAAPYFAVPCSPGDMTTVVIEDDGTYVLLAIDAQIIPHCRTGWGSSVLYRVTEEAVAVHFIYFTWLPSWKSRDLLHACHLVPV